jgi:hypothetical protein
MKTADSSLWLIVIVFSYVFGLFLIFVIIWLIWYGISVKKRRMLLQSSHNQHRHSSASGHNFLQYDYTSQTSLNSRPPPTNSLVGLAQLGCMRSSHSSSSSRFSNNGSPGPVRNNPAFNQNNTDNNNKYLDDLSTHSASFVHSYNNNKHRI